MRIKLWAEHTQDFFGNRSPYSYEMRGDSKNTRSYAFHVYGTYGPRAFIVNAGNVDPKSLALLLRSKITQ